MTGVVVLLAEGFGSHRINGAQGESLCCLGESMVGWNKWCYSVKYIKLNPVAGYL